ncbi:hypothetical protein L596_015336 [Steinernema carpocapsae]|uniref:Uncharacterized protein n=1 Tax=Steinernema carpocapsae TaxID=34508 RepID=A0A4U5NFJ6_STECR|nr:hypothetical protein L596_015336 [Steinernema carpocapsae]
MKETPCSVVVDFREPGFFEIGYTGDDTFDINHIDYEVCWGCCHTEQSGKVLTVLSFLVSAGGLVYYITSKDVTEIILFSFFTASCVLLLFGVFTHRHRFILPFLIFKIVNEAFDSYHFVSCSISLVKKLDSADTKIGEAMLREMLSMIFSSVGIVLSFWLIWVMYIHYCYLRARPRNLCFKLDENLCFKKRLIRNIWFAEHCNGT